jgi:peptidyl-prolyl cis-trans isomerase D
LLDSFRKGQRWLTLIFVSVIGLVFVFFLGVGGGFGPSTPTGSAIVQLDDVRLGSRDFAREKYNTEARLRQELGESYDQLGADRYVDSQALGSLINSVILSTAAEEMGLQVTQDELRRVVQANPLFIDGDGRFSPEAFDRFAEYEYGSQRAFIQSYTRSLLGQKLVWLLIGQTTLSDAEVDLLSRYELEEVRLAYVSLDAGTLPAAEALEDDAIEAYSNSHEAELKTLYELQALNGQPGDDFSEPERVRARHILILAAQDASVEDESEARDRAEAAHDRIVAGEDFSIVAGEVSEDVGTAQNGGDLGLFARGDNDPVLDEAAFSLEPGAISDVVRSTYGFHLIRVDEKIAPVVASFESSRLALARQQATEAAALDRANRIGDALAAALASGSSLEDAAPAQGISVDRTPGVKRRNDGFIPGIGPAKELLAAVFTLEEGESSPEIFELAGRRVLIQVLERSNPSVETIAAARSARRKRDLAGKQNLILQTWINDYRSRLELSGRLKVNAELALGS